VKIKNKKIILRYGENPHQKAYLIKNANKTIFDFQIGGKKLSYNNIIDVDSGLKCLKEFKEPTSIIIKHTNPCGVASAKNIETAFKKSYNSDSKSAFGGIILLNRKVTPKLAKIILNNFFEMVVSPSFDRKALNILKEKKGLILLKTPKYKENKMNYRSTLFGDLYQSNDKDKIGKSFLKLVSSKKTSTKYIEDLLFSLKVVKHLKSNAIVLSKNKQTIGLGHGQTNRVDALKAAINIKNANFNINSFVCSSDGFFPFTDSINLLKKNGCKALAQPSGSINDKKIVSFAKENNIWLYFIKNRLFKH
tara:strand:- start:1546 stop:2463 length:918 start_codon:yes stop_codon:yes gene_type:complete